MSVVWPPSTDSFKPYQDYETGVALRLRWIRKLETSKEVDLHTRHLSPRRMEIRNTAPSERVTSRLTLNETTHRTRSIHSSNCAT